MPNISGVWQVRGFDRITRPVEGGNPPWQPWNQKAYEERVAAEKAGQATLRSHRSVPSERHTRHDRRAISCRDRADRGQDRVLYEVQHQFRVVYMNAKHPNKVEPSLLGHAVGHWEGDTLVIDTVGLVKQTQIDEAGTLHSEQLHVVERIRKVNDTLEILFTIEDPKAFTKPWTSKRVWHWRPDVRFLEYVCEENNRNAPDENGVLRNF